MRIIKDRRIVEDAWVHLCDEALPVEGKVTVPFNRWRVERQALIDRDGEIGVRLNGEAPEELEGLAGDLDKIQLVVLEVPRFTDGRVFSLARLLRERYGYREEIRVLGDFLYDQIFYLERVGVDAFEYRGSESLEEALRAFSTFSVKYQPAADGGGLIQQRGRGA